MVTRTERVDGVVLHKEQRVSDIARRSAKRQALLQLPALRILDSADVDEISVTQRESLARPKGFEPPTSSSGGRRSIR